MQPEFYRYLFAVRPGPRMRHRLLELQAKTGQVDKAIPEHLLHLTLCVVQESVARDPFLLRRAEAALSVGRLSSGPLWFGRVRGGANGAMISSRGRKPEFMELYRDLVDRLAERDILPLYRKAGLHPHFTLGHDPCAFESFLILEEWVPNELLLIESEVGKTTHNVLARWPLLPPPQGLLPFDLSPPPPPLLAAGGRR